MASATAPAALMDRDLAVVDPEIAHWIEAERRRQNEGIELIASENWVSRAVRKRGIGPDQQVCEGYPGRRYYGGSASSWTKSSRWRSTAREGALAPSTPCPAASGSRPTCPCT